MNNEKYVFVTVGTTQFDKLIDAVTTDEFLTLLVKKGYTKVLLQTGKGKVTKNINRYDIRVESYNFKPSIKYDLEHASLVISHAGAGSILESLALNKFLLVVINEDLMDNHQVELAEKLASLKYLHYTKCNELLHAMQHADMQQLVKMPPPNSQVFGAYLDDLMGMKM